MFENFKKEDYRFVLQECKECGAKFPVIYQFKEARIAPFGFSCDHIPNHRAGFSPVGGQPTFDEWYTEQLRAHACLTSHA